MTMKHILSLIILATFHFGASAQEEEEGDNCIDASYAFPIDEKDIDRRYVSYDDSNFVAQWMIIEGHEKTCERVGDSVKGVIDRYVKDFKAQFEEGSPCADEPAEPYCNWEAGISARPHYIGEEVESFVLNEWAYTGGAHGNYYWFGMNFVDGELVELTDVLSEEAIAHLETLVIEELQRQNAPDVMGERATLDLTKYDFVIDPEGIQFLFSPYQVGPYIAGSFCARVSWREISDVEGYPLVNGKEK